MKLKKKSTADKLLIISISIILSLSVVGFGYAKWGTVLSVCSRITTGSMNVVFDSYEILTVTDPSPDIGAGVSDIKISGDGKRLDIKIENAYPGYSAVIKYSIKNDGSIPVYYKIINDTDADNASEEESPVLVDIDNSGDILDANGSTSEGTIMITVTDKVTENITYDLDFNLDYVQYNEQT